MQKRTLSSMGRGYFSQVIAAWEICARDSPRPGSQTSFEGICIRYLPMLPGLLPRDSVSRTCMLSLDVSCNRVTHSSIEYIFLVCTSLHIQVISTSKPIDLPYFHIKSALIIETWPHSQSSPDSPPKFIISSSNHSILMTKSASV